MDTATAAGWFTSFFPTLFHSEDSLAATLSATKDALRGVPNKGIGYGYLRYIAGRSELASDFPYTFNYLGKAMEVSHEGIEEVQFLMDHMRDPDVSCPHEIELNASLKDQQLQCHFRFNGQSFDSSAIDGFLRLFKNNFAAAYDAR